MRACAQSAREAATKAKQKLAECDSQASEFTLLGGPRLGKPVV